MSKIINCSCPQCQGGASKFFTPSNPCPVCMGNKVVELSALHARLNNQTAFQNVTDFYRQSELEESTRKELEEYRAGQLAIKKEKERLRSSKPRPNKGRTP